MVKYSNQEFKSLKKVCKPVVDYLKNNFNLHCAVVITDDQIKLVEDKIGIPVKK